MSSRICWFEDSQIDSIDRRKSTEPEQGDVTLWKFNENTQLFYYLWRQHSGVNSSPGQCRCRAVSRWRALPAGRPPLVSPVSADIIISLSVLDQVCLVCATNGYFQIQVRPQGSSGRAGRRQEQSSCQCTHHEV